MKRTTLLFVAALMLAACGVKSSPGKPPMTQNDKLQSCDDILLEINDAQFLRDKAEKNKGVTFRNIIWPFGYPQTLTSANQAIENTSERIRYLSNIYAIKQCAPVPSAPSNGDAPL